MRRPLAAVLALALLLGGPAARAGEEEDALARLEERVEMLLVLVSELRTAVAQLEQRILALEMRVAAERPAEEAPSGLVEEAVEERIVTPELAGHYVLDREATEAAILEKVLPLAESAEEEAEMRREVHEQFEGIAMELRLEPDGSFVVKLSGADEDEQTALGVWTQEGTTITLRTTHEDGEETDTPQEVRGTWADDRLRMEEEGEELVLVFRRP